MTRLASSVEWSQVRTGHSTLKWSVYGVKIAIAASLYWAKAISSHRHLSSMNLWNSLLNRRLGVLLKLNGLIHML